MVFDLGYKGKVCVVTGAASGMGKALTEILVDLGASVYAVDRVEAPVQGVKESVIADLGDRESVDAAFRQIPDSIDAYFGVAGVSGVHTNFADTMRINFTANKYVTDKYLVDRIAQGGSISFVTSNGGVRWEDPSVREELIPFAHGGGWDDLARITDEYEAEFGTIPGTLGYILSKRALNYWIAEQVERFAELGRVRINAVLPAMTVSGMLPEFAEMKGGQEAVEADLGPAGRLAEAKEMAQVLVFLGSDMASYISGAHISVDFGMNARTLAGLDPEKLRWTLHGVLSRQPGQ
ncbi:SDR family oxidoreductase [Arthrobacter sunyaminii]|uniref:SDR family oxidoreductase n=1 Tax=Arthrobacter sunyaminii TaxID=2816859 RepID=A0A975S6A4_9MICC|nr:SDR family oxidoreductase [Arthrobacter sunyaminii]MBO0909814.1 SDR family oxidoreductase [Arthrobacter sunyaminii]QWQ36604.1 SDR family oxidoreductase [Arthrobacter sunyaminii]